MPPKYATKEPQEQGSQQNKGTTTVPAQGKAEDYFYKSAHEIADYSKSIHEYAFTFFTTKNEMPARQAILDVLSELEPYTTECEWNGISLETYKREFKERFKTACLEDFGTNSILTNLVKQNFKDANSTDVDPTDADPINIINDFLSSYDSENPTSQPYESPTFQPYLISAQKVYSYSYDNKYEAYRVKAKNETLPAMKKLFLRRLYTDRDKIIDQKVRPKNENDNEDVNEEAKEFPRLKISGMPWSTIVNDAFVGGGIDAGARFKISDLYDSTMETIVDLSHANLPTEGEESKLEKVAKSKLEQFWKICKTDPNLYKGGKQVESYRYTVLAREIAQLLKRGWIFKTFPRKKESGEYYKDNQLNLIAFKDENAAKEYSKRKNEMRQKQESAKDKVPAGT